MLRQAEPPLVAVVRLRKGNEWCLPKGKLDHGETPRAAAEREAMEETGHAVAVHEFLGTLVYETRGGPKVVHYWRMEAGLAPVRELMRDVKAVDWLPLGEAVERLSRGYERAFLEHVGPMAMAAAGASWARVCRERRSLRPGAQSRPRGLSSKLAQALSLARVPGAMQRASDAPQSRDPQSSRARDASGVSAASRAHSTLHGVVFAILCPGPEVYRRRVFAPSPGHEIVGASR